MENYIDYKLIGKRIKLARIKAGLTQYQLHNLTEISITQISAYENGKRNIGLLSLKKIADATGTTMDELFSGKNEDKPIVSSTNKGKLIVNCITALFENKVITTLYRENENEFVPLGLGYYYQIGFCDYVDILDDYIKKLVDFEANKENYPNPDDFKKQLLEAASKRINDMILKENKSLL